MQHRYKTKDQTLLAPSYYKGYVDQVPNDIDLLDSLQESQAQMLAILTGLSDEQWLYRYAEGKWSVKEMFQHLMDSERVFAYRILRISRGDQTPMPGFDQDAYVPTSKADARSAESLLHEYHAVRNASIVLLQNLPESAWLTEGTASGHPFTAQAIAFVIAGHERHHIALLKDRYFPA